MDLLIILEEFQLAEKNQSDYDGGGYGVGKVWFSFFW